jgi:hypothetical protein
MADWEDRAGRRPRIPNVAPADSVGWQNTDDEHGHEDCSPREAESSPDQFGNSANFGRGTAHKGYSPGSGADVWNAEEDAGAEDGVDGSLPVSPTSHDGGARARSFRLDKEQKAGAVPSQRLAYPAIII